MSTQDYTKQVANTIMEQLGGGRFLFMTGSKFQYYETDENNNVKITIKLSKNKNGWQLLTITLNALDLYDIEFIKTRQPTKKLMNSYLMGEIDNRPTAKVTKELIENVYGDMLQSIFTEKTELYTKL